MIERHQVDEEEDEEEFHLLPYPIDEERSLHSDIVTLHKSNKLVMRRGKTSMVGAMDTLDDIEIYDETDVPKTVDNDDIHEEGIYIPCNNEGMKRSAMYTHVEECTSTQYYPDTNKLNTLKYDTDEMKRIQMSNVIAIRSTPQHFDDGEEETETKPDEPPPPSASPPPASPPPASLPSASPPTASPPSASPPATSPPSAYPASSPHPSSSHVSVVFTVQDAAAKMELHSMYVYGNIREIGNWKTDRAIPLLTTKNTYPIWKSPPVTIKRGEFISYRFFKTDATLNAIVYEQVTGGNRSLKLKSLNSVVVSHVFGVSGATEKVIEKPDAAAHGIQVGSSNGRPSNSLRRRDKKVKHSSTPQYTATSNTSEGWWVRPLNIILEKGFCCLFASDYTWKPLSSDMQAASFAMLS